MTWIRLPSGFIFQLEHVVATAANGHHRWLAMGGGADEATFTFTLGSEDDRALAEFFHDLSTDIKPGRNERL